MGGNNPPGSAFLALPDKVRFTGFVLVHCNALKHTSFPNGNWLEKKAVNALLCTMSQS